MPLYGTGYGRKSAHARMQPPTLSLEDSDAAASAVHAPYTRLCTADARGRYAVEDRQQLPVSLGQTLDSQYIHA